MDKVDDDDALQIDDWKRRDKMLREIRSSIESQHIPLEEVQITHIRKHALEALSSSSLDVFGGLLRILTRISNPPEVPMIDGLQDVDGHYDSSPLAHSLYIDVMGEAGYLQNGEVPLYFDPFTWMYIKSKMSPRAGILYLTNKRLIILANRYETPVETSYWIVHDEDPFGKNIGHLRYNKMKSIKTKRKTLVIDYETNYLKLKVTNIYGPGVLRFSLPAESIPIMGVFPIELEIGKMKKSSKSYHKSRQKELVKRLEEISGLKAI